MYGPHPNFFFLKIPISSRREQRQGFQIQASTQEGTRDHFKKNNNSIKIESNVLKEQPIQNFITLRGNIKSYFASTKLYFHKFIFSKLKKGVGAIKKVTNRRFFFFNKKKSNLNARNHFNIWFLLKVQLAS